MTLAQPRNCNTALRPLPTSLVPQPAPVILTLPVVLTTTGTLVSNSPTPKHSSASRAAALAKSEVMLPTQSVPGESTKVQAPCPLVHNWSSACCTVVVCESKAHAPGV